MGSEPTLVELFAGISGFGLGFERSGFRTALQVEIDDNCQELLTRKFQGALHISDVRSIASAYRRKIPLANEKWKEIFEALRAANVWCGGFPCQDLSVAGARAGLAGERSGLWFSFRRLIALFRPPWVVIENVPGLLSSNGGGDLSIILDGLEKLGYWWAYRTLDAQYFGLAQRRKRVFIVASLGSLSCAEVLFEPESMCGDSAPSRETGQRPAPCISARTEGGGGLGTDFETGGGLSKSLRAQSQCSHREDSETFVTVAPPIAGVSNGGALMDQAEQQTTQNPSSLTSGPVVSKWARGGGRSGDECYNLVSHTLKAEYDASEDGTGRGVPIVPDVAPCLTQNYGKQVDNSDTNAGPMCVEFRTAGNCGPFEQGDKTGALNTATDPNQNIVAFTERTRKDGRNIETQEDVAYALTNPGFGRRTHSRQIQQAQTVRRLTPLECERLQGFPDGWTEGFSDSVRYRMLGNAVAVPVAEWIAKRLLAVIQKDH